VVQKQLVVLIQYIHLQDQEHLRHKIMTSTIKVDNIQDQDGNNIINENANTITIGASGDTVTLASGASQSGFGRTGTVDWQTTKKTANFTAANGEGYFVDTTSAAITVTLPASPSAGDIVAIADYAGTAQTNEITIARNGSNIEGEAQNGAISIERESKTLVYVDATQGWLAVNDNADKLLNPLFVTATGGTITTCGNFKIHTFTGPGTFTVSCAGNPLGSSTVDYLVVAGGGGGGGSRSPGGGAGAGGAGGYRESPGTASGCYTVSPRGAAPAVALPVSVQAYPITVGGGGANAPSSPPPATNGANSVFSTITSAGGGFGGSPNSPQHPGNPGGSGGGGPWHGRPNNVGSGNTPPVNPAQGTDGGSGSGAPNYAGGGGGGALSAGSPAPQPGGATGGAGGGAATSCITGSPVARAGGGGGGGSTNPGSSGGSATGGGGAGGGGPNGGGSSGTANTGGGGGAGAGDVSSGGSGGSGIVVIRYKFQ
jgi:hypothetical protein